MGMPESRIWLTCSPWSLLDAATLEKMEPISVKSRPEICAESPTVLRTLVSWSPCLTPDATSWDAVVAASPRP